MALVVSSNPFEGLILQPAEIAKADIGNLTDSIQKKMINEFQVQLAILKKSAELVKTTTITDNQIERYRSICIPIISESKSFIIMRIQEINEFVLEKCLLISEAHATQKGMAPRYNENYGHGTNERLREINYYLSRQNDIQSKKDTYSPSNSPIETYIENLKILTERAAVIKERILSTKQKFVDVFANASLDPDNINKLSGFNYLENVNEKKFQGATIEYNSLKRKINSLKDSFETHVKEQNSNVDVLNNLIKNNEIKIVAATKSKKLVQTELNKQINLYQYQKTRINKLIDQTAHRLEEIESEMASFLSIFPAPIADDTGTFKASKIISHQQKVVKLKEKLKNFTFNEKQLLPDNEEVLVHFYKKISSDVDVLLTEHNGAIKVKFDTLVTTMNNSIREILKHREELNAISNEFDVNFEQVNNPAPSILSTAYNAITNVSLSSLGSYLPWSTSSAN